MIFKKNLSGFAVNPDWKEGLSQKMLSYAPTNINIIENRIKKMLNFDTYVYEWSGGRAGIVHA